MNSSAKLINIGSRQLLAFLEIVRLQSFSKAAEQVPMSASGISMLVKEMEGQLGARLFDRTTRTVTLTDAGRRLQPVAELIVNELRALGAAVDGSRAAVRSRLDVAATPMVASGLLPPVVRAFAGSHPQVRVQISDVDLNAVRQRVLDGDADIGLGFFFKPAIGLLRQPLCKFRLMRIGPPAARSAGTAKASGLGPNRPWSSLATLPLIGLPASNPIQALIESHLARIGRAREDRPTMNLIGTLMGMVQAGVGHAVVPSFVLGDCLQRGLSVSMLVQPAVGLDLFAVTRRGAQAKPAAVDFAMALKRETARLVA